jgi:hypothetical protein
VSQASFQKQQREKLRRERAAAKLARRAERSSAPEIADAPASDQAAVLAELAELHERFGAGLITFEDFEVSKQQLTQQLDVR